MADDELIYYDIAGQFGAQTDDAWEAMASSYEYIARLLIAVLQKAGVFRIPAEWFELTDGFILTALPLPNGSWRLEAVRRGEVKSNPADVAKLREKWERMYKRVEPTDG